jgi:hypothetical protein
MLISPPHWILCPFRLTIVFSLSFLYFASFVSGGRDEVMNGFSSQGIILCHQMSRYWCCQANPELFNSFDFHATPLAQPQ